MIVNLGDITNTSEGGSSSSESSSQGGNSTSEGGTSTSQGGNSTSEGGTSTSQGGSSSSESQSSNGDNTNDNVINIGDNTSTSSSEGGNNTSGDSTSTSEGGDAIVGDHTDTNNNSSEGGNASSEGSNENNNQTNGGNSSVGDHTNNNTNTCTDNCNTEEPLPIIRGLVVSYYRDIDGNILADNEIIQNDINSYYATKEKAINNYKLIEIDGNPIGKIGTEPISITYYYQKVDLQESKQGIVVVHYVDENGTAIANDIKLVGRESSSYATSQIIINGYDFVKVIGSPVGEFNDTVIEVTYVYKKRSSEETPSINIGTVVVHYIDTDNNVVGGDVILHGLEGLSYVTNEKNIFGYNYIRVEGSKTGVFIDGNIDVTYVYEKNDNESSCTNNCSPTIIVNPPSCDDNCNEEKDGVVLVKYLDTKGNVLTDDIILKDSVGNIYTTIKKEFDGYSLVSVIGNTSGVYQDGIQNVTYIYDKESSFVTSPINYGTVKVSYMDLDGNLLNSIIEYKDEVGKDYHTVQYNFAGYQFVRVLGSPDGQFSEGEKSVIYLYKKHEEQVPETEKKYGIVLTKYIDTFGNILCDDIIIRDEVDQDYVTSEKKFDNYNLITVVGNRIGKFIDGVLEVDYIYHKEDECEDKECPKPPVCPDKDDCSNKNGIVLVRYIDNNGNTLSDEITLEGKINEFYVTSQKSFDGYSFVTVTGNRFGKYIDGTLEVTYIYKKTNTTPSEPDKPEVGTVIVKYIDTLGNVLHEDKVLEDEIGKNYQTFPVNIPGYTYRKVLGMPNGKYSLDDQVIIYIYDKITSPRAQGKVIVHYIDENGNKLLDDKVSTGYVDDPYKSIQESISKYDFIKVIGNETGNYQNDDIHITYVYGKKKGKVIAHYVDIYGNMIGYDIIQEGYLDDKYETKLRKFRGYDFVQIVGDLAGQYRTSDIHVTYIYQKREEQVQPIGSPIIIPDETAMLSTKRSVSSPSLSIYDPIEIPNTGIDYKKDYFTFFILMICNISIILYLRKKVCLD